MIYIAECRFLPLVRRKIPVAGASLVVVSSHPVIHDRVPPVVEADLQQGAAGNSGTHLYGTALEVSGGQILARRSGPEVPYAISASAYGKNDGGISLARTLVIGGGCCRGSASCSSLPNHGFRRYKPPRILARSSLRMTSFPSIRQLSCVRAISTEPFSYPGTRVSAMAIPQSITDENPAGLGSELT
jgi:hypothetical protein